MTLRDRHVPRLAPPAGPRYNLFELAVLMAFIGITLYLIPASTNSAAEAWLTMPGQRAGGGVIGVACTVAAILTYRESRTGAAAWVLAVVAIMWSATLVAGLVVSPTPWRPGSLVFAVLFLFFAQVARKAWGQHVVERDYPQCRHPSQHGGRE